MANGFGGLYIGSSGLQSAQNGLNVIANNLANVDTSGYVRQQVVYADKSYTSFANASISMQRSGLGVQVGDIVHSRDVFLDASYRTQSSRQAFYASLFDATSEVETFLQELDGADYKQSLKDLYEAFAEYAKDPSDSANQNLVVQKSELFVSRAMSVYNGLKQYQATINTKISNDVARINEIGQKIVDLNVEIQRTEASQVETAMDARDERDLLLDELSSLCRISYNETIDGIVKVKIEGQEFVNERSYNAIGLHRDETNNFVNPYWTNLSDVDREDYYYTFNLDNICAENNNDMGEVKSLLLSRGDHYATYLDLQNADENFIVSSMEYERGVGNSVMMNAQAEMDVLFHSIITSINDLFSPLTSVSEDNQYANAKLNAGGKILLYDETGHPVYELDEKGEVVTDENGDPVQKSISLNAKIADTKNCSVGSDGKIPPAELFVRTGAARYTKYTVQDTTDGSFKDIYVYNEENPKDQATCYTTHSTSVNPELTENQSLLAYKTQTGEINYDLAQKISTVWDDNRCILNPSDTTPTTFQGFYTKYVGELGTNGSIFKATSESLQTTVDSVEANRQGVFGVSSDEELTSMIKFQNAYNASSRYINVVGSMIDSLLAMTS